MKLSINEVTVNTFLEIPHLLKRYRNNENKDQDRKCLCFFCNKSTRHPNGYDPILFYWISISRRGCTTKSEKSIRLYGCHKWSIQLFIWLNNQLRFVWSCYFVFKTCFKSNMSCGLGVNPKIEQITEIM